jgi:hypothetical protein
MIGLNPFCTLGVSVEAGMPPTSGALEVPCPVEPWHTAQLRE